MKKELNLISEISRVREMMGFADVNYTTKKYINETINGNNKFLLTEAAGPKEDWAIMLYKAITGDDNYATLFGKSVADQWDAGARNLAEVLEREGLDDIGKLMNNIGIAKGIDPSRVTNEMVDDALKLYFKNNPDVAEKILKNSATFIQDTLKGRDFLSILGAGNRQLADDLAYIFGIQINPAEAAILKPQLDALSQQFRNSGLNLNDPAIKEILDGFENLSKTSDAMGGTTVKPEPSPDAANIPKAEMAGGKTKAEMDAEKLEADRIAQEEADAKARLENEKADADRYDKAMEDQLDEVIPTLKSDPNYVAAYSWWSRLLESFGLGKASDFLKTAESKFKNMTLAELQNFETSATYLSLKRQLEALAQARGNKAGRGLDNVTKRTKSLGGFFAAFDKLMRSIPIIGRVYKFVGALIGLLIMVWSVGKLKDNFEFVNDLTENIRIFLKDITPDFIISDPKTTLPDCLTYIKGYYDIPMEVRDKVNLIGLTCDNVKQEDPTNFASNIVFVKGGSKLDKTGNKITTKDSFIVTIGGVEVVKEVGGPIVPPVVSPTPPTPTPTPPTPTPVPGVYTNTQVDFIKWVGVTHPGKYGTEYEWEGTAGYYYPGGGDSGNAMTFDPSGWK